MAKSSEARDGASCQRLARVQRKPASPDIVGVEPVHRHCMRRVSVRVLIRRRYCYGCTEQRAHGIDGNSSKEGNVKLLCKRLAATARKNLLHGSTAGTNKAAQIFYHANNRHTHFLAKGKLAAEGQKQNETPRALEHTSFRTVTNAAGCGVVTITAPSMPVFFIAATTVRCSSEVPGGVSCGQDVRAVRGVLRQTNRQ